MRIETNKFKVIIPDEGKLLVNHRAKTISDEVYLGINADASEWVEVAAEDAEALQKQWESEDFVEATEEDYQKALIEMGVKLDG